MKDTYFETQQLAIETAFNEANIKGFEVIEPDRLWTEHVDYGKTVKYSLELRKAGKVQRKMLHIILYRMDEGKYELTHYIN